MLTSFFHDHQRRFGVFDHGLDPGCGMRWIQRLIRGTGAKNPQRRKSQIFIPGNQDGNNISRTDPFLFQAGCQPSRNGIQLIVSIGPALIA